EIIQEMKRAGIRAEIDSSDDRMQKKIRNAQAEKIPFMLIAGEEDQKSGAVSFRFRNGEQRNGVPIQEAIALVQRAVLERTQV
ncbi:MAG: His/Gly/Thr/Pro-type tRNA ligase C-terminal domain-containing protein, partial [Actinomycetota bacterium]